MDQTPGGEHGAPGVRVDGFLLASGLGDALHEWFAQMERNRDFGEAREAREARELLEGTRKAHRADYGT